MNRFKPIEVRPTNGGRLMTAVSKDSVGLNNYTIKRDFRRDLDREIRAEGYDKFHPNTVPSALATQHWPAGTAGDGSDPILLITECRRSNGQTAMVVGTKSTLWRFSGSDNGLYVDATYVDSTYFETTNIGAWVKIGDGFSYRGGRWEAEQCGDYLVLNNGVDLPVTYRLQDSSVVPIYELREQGVVSVGTIAVHDGVLVCGDISLVDDATLISIMSPVTAGVTAAQTGITSGGSVRAKLNSGVDGVAGNRITADSAIFMNTDVGKKIRLANGATRTITALIGAQPTATVTVDGVADTAEPYQPFYWPAAGTTNFVVTSSGGFFTADMVGLKLTWDSGYIRQIISYTSPTSIVVDQDGPVPSGAFKIENAAAYAAYTSQGKIDRIQYRLFWSMPDQPRRFGATVPVSVAALGNYLTLAYPAKSLEPGMNLSIPGAGVDGGTLSANIIYVSPAHNLVAIDRPAITAVTNVLVEASDAASSIVAFEDLVDDGSAIIKMLTLRQVLVIYRETSIFLGVLTGNTSSPFTFDRPIRTSNSLRFKHTLILVNPVLDGGVPFHIYAGKGSFFRFDLITKSPVEIQELELVKDTFFSNAPTQSFILGVEEIPYELVLDTGSQPISGGVGAAGYLELMRDNDGTERIVPGPVGYNLPPTVSARLIYGIGSDRVFAAENSLTREIFFCFPGKGSDKAIRYNYRDKTVSTTSGDYSACATIRRPLNPSSESGRQELWFVMGNATRTLFRYGLLQADEISSLDTKATKAGSTVSTAGGVSFFEPYFVGRSLRFSSGKVFAITAWINELTVTVVAAGSTDDITVAEAFTLIPSIFHRDWQGYDSVLASGIDSFGSSYKEKQMDAYALILGSGTAQNSPINVSIMGGVNPSESHILGSKVITKPKTQNLVPVAFLENYFGDQITVSGINNPVEVAARILSIAGVDSASFVRRPQ